MRPTLATAIVTDEPEWGTDRLLLTNLMPEGLTLQDSFDPEAQRAIHRKTGFGPRGSVARRKRPNLMRIT